MRRYTSPLELRRLTFSIVSVWLRSRVSIRVPSPALTARETATVPPTPKIYITNTNQQGAHLWLLRDEFRLTIEISATTSSVPRFLVTITRIVNLTNMDRIISTMRNQAEICKIAP